MPWRFNPFTGNLDETDIPAFNGEVTLGSAASPSIFFTGDTNTGIYSPGADQVALSTNGTGRLFVDASGNIKLTSNQYQALSHKTYGYSASYGAVTVGAGNNNQGNIALGVDISAISGDGFTGQNQVIFPATGGLIPNNAGSNFVGFYNRNASDALILGPATLGGVSSGPLTLTSTSVGIGTTNPGVALDVNGDARADGLYGYGDTNTGIEFPGSDVIVFKEGGTERARIDSSGRLLVGTSSNSGGALLQVNGDRIRVATAKTPASASDTGTAGEVCWDTNYIYVCTATNTWKRAALSTW